MKPTKSQQQALLQVLSRLYGEIAQAEGEYGLMAGPADFRPRIEYFHDAVREFTAGRATGHEATGRLTVESLAYDIGLLRQVSANPVSRVALPQKLSPGVAVAPYTGKAASGRPDADLRYRLMDLYRNYTVLFVALLVEACDRNYYTRIEDHNAEVEELAALEDAIRQAGQGANIEAIAAAQIADPDLRKRVLASLKGKRRAQEAVAETKTMMKETDKTIARIEKAHLHYLSAQLNIYQESKDLVKKMMMSGMNIVGDFLGSAMAEAARASRGR